jgi:hypothetical protein
MPFSSISLPSNSVSNRTTVLLCPSLALSPALGLRTKPLGLFPGLNLDRPSTRIALAMHLTSPFAIACPRPVRFLWPDSPLASPSALGSRLCPRPRTRVSPPCPQSSPFALPVALALGHPWPSSSHSVFTLCPHLALGPCPCPQLSPALGSCALTSSPAFAFSLYLSPSSPYAST